MVKMFKDYTTLGCRYVLPLFFFAYLFILCCYSLVSNGFVKQRQVKISDRKSERASKAGFKRHITRQ